MPSVRLLIVAAALAGAPPVSAQSFPAQPVQTMPRPNPDADALADAMRRLGANPRDLAALIEAGELSLKLGDVNAAAALFKRADMIDPMNGRVKAGMARILVSQERPGEALRYFDQAAGYGLDPRSFAGDRGLAYDLIGEQERAQRDYRTSLKAAASDEVQRRYALSLGISGNREAALTEIDALLQRNDRGAWRARAFILAMTGDVPGAEKIAQTMMPRGMGAALSPFFARLAALPPRDRAFAVHFGELRPTPARLADAKLTPPLPVLAPEPGAPAQVAAAAPPVPVAPVRRDRRAEREEARRIQSAQRAAARARRADGRRVALARNDANTAPIAGSAPSSDETRRGVRVANGVAYGPSRAVVQSLPNVTPQAVDEAPAPGRAAALPTAAPVPPTPVQTATVPAAAPPAPPAPVQAAASSVAAVASTSLAPKPPVQVAAAAPLPQPGFSAAAPASVPGPSAPMHAPAAAPPSPPATTAASAAAAAPAAAPAMLAGGAAPVAAAATPPSAAPVVARMNEDSILARIMAGISIPAAELGVAPVRPPAPAAEPGAATAAPASAASAGQAVQRTPAAKPADAPEPKPARLAAAATGRPAARAAADLADRKDAVPAKAEAEAVDPKVAARKAAAERKAAEAKKLADTKKAEERKKAAEEARAARAEPSRIWVQVAGGANVGDLPKAWAAVRAKAPALAGRSAYSTPLRATNRLVTGPFKTDAEARAFVNTLARQGVSAFPFTSEKGQKMTKLGGK